MTKIKQIYLDVLIRIFPGPLGRGMSYKEVAKDLNISKQAVKYRLKQFKNKYPVAWDRFKNIRKISQKQRPYLRWKDDKRQKLWLHTLTDLAGPKGDSNKLLKIFETEGKVRGFF